MNQRLQSYFPIAGFSICILTILSLNITGAPPITDADWSVVNRGGIIGTNGPIKSTVYFRGYLYAGGKFSVAGTVMANNIAKWDGKIWSALGTGTNGMITTIALDSSGNLYAAGRFDSAGGLPTKNIAKWNGTTWSALGAGCKGDVSALTTSFDGILYLTGRFDTIGGIYARNVAKWNGTSWDSLGPGVDDYIYAACLDRKGILYTGGRRVMRWDGISWNMIDSVSDFFGRFVRVLATDTANNLYAGGDFTKIGSQKLYYCAKWNCSAWEDPVHWNWDPMLSTSACINSIAFDGAGIGYLGGSMNSTGSEEVCFVSFGKSNTPQYNVKSSGPYDEEILSVSCNDSNEVFIGGSFTELYGQQYRETRNYIAKLQGKTNIALSSGFDCKNIEAIVSDRKGRVYVGGSFTALGDVKATYLAMLEKGQWKSIGVINNPVTSLAVDSNNILYISGPFSSAGGVPARKIAQWDGSVWQALGKGLDDPARIMVCDGKGNLYAGGDFDSAGGIPAHQIARWNGSRWDSLGSGFKDEGITYVAGIAFDNIGTLTAAGRCKRLNNIARWNGDSWIPFSPGVQSYVDHLIIRGEDIYIGSRAGCMYRWYGNGWAALGGDSITSITLDRLGNLYVAQQSTAYGYYIWRIDESGKFSKLGSGTDSAITVISLVDSTLYAAGEFLVAGGKLSPFLTKVNIHVASSPTIKPRDIPHYAFKPIISFGDGVITVRNAAPGPCRIELFTISGRRVLSRDIDATTGQLHQSISLTANAAYICQLQSAQGVLVKMVLNNALSNTKVLSQRKKP